MPYKDKEKQKKYQREWRGKRPLGKIKIARAKNSLWKKNNPDSVVEHAIRSRVKRNAKKRARKVKAILFKGGKCLKCGLEYNGKNGLLYHFHHRDPSSKEYYIDRMWASGLSWEDILKEINKCDLLCVVCHLWEHHPDEY